MPGAAQNDAISPEALLPPSNSNAANPVHAMDDPTLVYSGELA